ncbi:hypothetical protein GUJ93_ZPchr0006g45687 [Zizania palustris]|uniref:Uncharacterized protein n=1 Tax=Zizania palustris TaxID=103762 RepID=A0A8J5SCV5_ZIZPA|nr:hypothetical protein GUJ93_ZPchr0006g45687 [Zizania palustris]
MWCAVAGRRQQRAARLAVHAVNYGKMMALMKQIDDHLNQLQLEHAKLMTQADLARKSLSKLHAQVCELEEEVQMQKLVISENAEGEREAIRQLCFSLEHYRSGYQDLR